MSWVSEFPSELLLRPVGLIVLTGLDIVHNAIHKSIFDSFTSNRKPDRPALNFKYQLADADYSKSKPKRPTYDWYIPKGIMKSSWMLKHLDRIPSVVVIFFDLDWDEVLWKERQMECATRIEIVRESLHGRDTKVCMVLIQKNTPLPPGEDITASERATSLCTACNLSAKLLFILPISDHLIGYTIRLENAFYELSRGYYHTEARRVKTHKDYLNKTTHALLFVRHQFKIAFYNELKQDTYTALKHYKQAYSNLLELRMLDRNMLEIKVNAGIINFKICQLCFLHNTPLDAIAQFRRHIDFFKIKLGMPELAFEHNAWMSKQFQVLGDLFDEAIKKGLTAVQTQHPGLYYQQAAYNAIARKIQAQQIAPKEIPESVIQETLLALKTIEYFGQRPWRQSTQSIESPDPVKVEEGINALQALELRVDHSIIIIPLLGAAVGQFKKYKSPRMRRHLMIQMAEEYYCTKDYSKSLVLLSRVTNEYRVERWWNILTFVLLTLLKASYLLCNMQEYVAVCIELIGIYGQISDLEKIRIQNNLQRISQGEVVEIESSTQGSEELQSIWKNEVCQERVCSINTTSLVPFFEVSVYFEKDIFNANDKVIIHAYLRSHAIQQIQFSKFSVELKNQGYSKYTTIENKNELVIEPNSMIHLAMSFTPQPIDVGKQFEILTWSLEYGRIFMYGNIDKFTPSISQQNNFFNNSADIFKGSNQVWCNLPKIRTTRIEARNGLIELSIDHLNPLFVHEKHRYALRCKSLEENMITNIEILIGIKDTTDMEIRRSTQLFDETEAKVQGYSNIVRSHQNLKKNDILNNYFFTLTTIPGNLSLFAIVSYSVEIKQMEDKIVCRCSEEICISLDIEDLLAISFECFNLKNDILASLYINEPFLLNVNLLFKLSTTVQLVSSQFHINDNSEIDGEWSSLLEELEVSDGDAVDGCIYLKVKPTHLLNVQLGKYVVTMKRLDKDSIQFSRVFDLPSMAVSQLPISVSLKLPAFALEGNSFNAEYILKNCTPFAQDVQIQMESSDSFMFAGHKLIHLKFQPLSETTLNYKLVPLSVGYASLPRLHVNLLRYPDIFPSIILKILPDYIFIKPSSRGIELL